MATVVDSTERGHIHAKKCYWTVLVLEADKRRWRRQKKCPQKEVQKAGTISLLILNEKTFF